MTVRNRLLAGVVLISLTVIAVMVALMLPRRNTTAPRLIPAVSLSHARATSTWGQTMYPLSHFYRTWLSHRTCGQSLSGEVRGRHGRYTQHFQHCVMRQDAVVVAYAPKPGPIATRTPQPQPRPTTPPQPTFAPVPTPTPDTSSPQAFVLALLNEDRRQHGVGPLTLDTTLSTGTTTCHGAQAHADAEASDGQIWHTSAAHPQESWPNDICATRINTAAQNTGMAYSDWKSALSQIDSLMVNEQPPNDGHRVNILNGALTRVGVGVAQSGGYTFVVTTFVG